MEFVVEWGYSKTEVAREKGVDLFFKDTINDRTLVESFAMVEYNFDINREEKEALIKYITPFFNDGEISRGEMEITNVLTAVRFLQTNGEVIRI